MSSKNSKPNINVFSYKFFARVRLAFLITIPFILMMVIPAILLDLFATIYQWVNFRAYNIPRVKRNKFIVIDRHHLKHLNFMEKFFCLYCGYFNGVMQYVSEIGVRTEEFWCPIKHSKKIAFEHKRYSNYLEYDDNTEYHAKRKQIRLTLQKELNEKELNP